MDEQTSFLSLIFHKSSTMEGGYIVLPSNASYKEFPNNKNHTYKVRLADRLRLDGSQWECALVNIHYSQNWYNVENCYLTVTVRQPAAEDSGSKYTFSQYQMDIRSGRYQKVDDLIDEIEKVIVSFKLERSLTIYYDKVRDITFLMIHDDNTTVHFSKNLANIFGFNENESYNRPSASKPFHQSDISPDLDQGFTSLYVYCNLVENRLVGDASVRLLRVIPVRNQKGIRNMYEEVAIPHYVPVTNTNTDVIEVNIRKDAGEVVSFRGGKVIVTVHIRKKQ
jgi:hypothetical protein